MPPNSIKAHRYCFKFGGIWCFSVLVAKKTIHCLKYEKQHFIFL